MSDLKEFLKIRDNKFPYEEEFTLSLKLVESDIIIAKFCGSRGRGGPTYFSEGATLYYATNE